MSVTNLRLSKTFAFPMIIAISLLTLIFGIAVGLTLKALREAPDGREDNAGFHCHPVKGESEMLVAKAASARVATAAREVRAPSIVGIPWSGSSHPSV